MSYFLMFNIKCLYRLYLMKKYYKKAKSNIYVTVTYMLQLKKWRCSNWERNLRLQWTWQSS